MSAQRHAGNLRGVHNGGPSARRKYASHRVSNKGTMRFPSQSTRKAVLETKIQTSAKRGLHKTDNFNAFRRPLALSQLPKTRGSIATISHQKRLE
jgi:hypothetical protein